MADKRRRRSLRIFYPRSNTPDQASVLSTTPSPIETRDHDRSAATLTNSDSSSPRVRPRVLSKPLHRSSVFGSFRSLHSLDDEKEALTKTDSKSSSLQGDAESPGRGLFGEHVRKAAELQVMGTSIFKKRALYMVLTESHLIRFKSQLKASEMFPIIPQGGKGSLPRSSMPSVGSYSEVQLSAYGDITQGVPLDEVVAVHRVEDGRPYFTIEVSYLDERGKRSSSLQMCLNSPREAEEWSIAIRDQAALRRSLNVLNYQQPTLEHITRMLSKDRDYHPVHFRVFKVAQRTAVRPACRMPSEELMKNGSNVCYLVIGLNKVHLVPVPKISGRSSTVSLVDNDTPSSFGITNLTSIKVPGRDDAFDIFFRTPLHQPYVASLASYDAVQIALWLRYASEYLRPEWTVQPFVFDVPPGVEDLMDPPKSTVEDNGYFDRTLIAFCAAFDVDTSRIYYSVDYHCEDAPCFRLLPPTGAGYTTMELLAVFRALRYNESFTSISFANINLSGLRNLYDPYADADDSTMTRAGGMIDIAGHSNLSMLQQEVRAVALKSRKLRRLDFTNCLPVTNDGKVSSGIPEALTPLCKKMLTNVDWITLNGVKLSDHDVDYLVDAASERQCHLRALEVAECGLSVHDVDVLLSTLGVHDNTMEVLNISGTQGRFSPELFSRAIGVFSRIRKLNLTRVQKTAGPEPLIAPEILISWRLESLHLNGTPLNEQSVDTISAYLASSKSNSLRELSVNQCSLTGTDLAVFFQSMTRDLNGPREMHVSANENRLGTGSSLFCKCIANNHAPSSFTMRMVDFEKEYQFRELLLALATNTTIRNLDMAQASLPYDASMETSEALKDMFARNSTLETLDISGDVAPLDNARLGIGLNIGLLGLEKNTGIKVLRVEHQQLGLQGANTLAGVIETNKTLVEIHCEHNDINLQSFTVLVNALKRNKHLLHVPTSAADRVRSMEKVKVEFEALESVDEPKSPTMTTHNAFRKSIQIVTQKAPRHRRHGSTVSNNSFTEREVKETLDTLEEGWNIQTARLQQYLTRNYQLACGVPPEDMDRNSDANTRPATADSLTRYLSQVNFDSSTASGLGIGTDTSLTKSGNGIGVDTKQVVDVGKKPRGMMFELPED